MKTASWPWALIDSIIQCVTSEITLSSQCAGFCRIATF
jgi:hypothetical protein